MSGERRAPRLYFSFRSPYSWLGLRLLETLHPTAPEEIEYIPYWEPEPAILDALRDRKADFLYAPMTRAKHLYILEDVRRLTDEFGDHIRWPLDRDGRWEVPHLAYLRARQIGREHELLRKLYDARWHEAADICDPDTVAAIARRMGLGPALDGAADDVSLRGLAIALLERAYWDGVFGVPFFIVGHQHFWGIDRARAFVTALRDRRERLERAQAGEAGPGP